MKLAWRQLIRDKRRFATALAGIAFAVLLMLMQMGFKDALYRSATSLLGLDEQYLQAEYRRPVPLRRHSLELLSQAISARRAVRVNEG